VSGCVICCSSAARARASTRVRHKKVYGEKGANSVLVEICKVALHSVVLYSTSQSAHIETRTFLCSTRALNLFFSFDGWVGLEAGCLIDLYSLKVY